MENTTIDQLRAAATVARDYMLHNKGFSKVTAGEIRVTPDTAVFSFELFDKFQKNVAYDNRHLYGYKSFYCDSDDPCKELLEAVTKIDGREMRELKVIMATQAGLLETYDFSSHYAVAFLADLTRRRDEIAGLLRDMR